MTISIRKAFEAGNSKRYNKLNILYFILISTILFSCTLLYNGSLSIVYKIIVFILNTIFAFGYIALANHNEINNKKEVIPSLYQIKDILFSGTKFLFGYTVLNIIISIIIFLPFATIGTLLMLNIKINSHYYIITFYYFIIYILCFIVSIWLDILYTMPLSFNFFETLKLSDIFHKQKADAFREKRKEYWLFVWKFILLILLIYTILFIFQIIYSNFVSNEILKLIFDYIRIIIGVVLFILYSPNLVKQLFNSKIKEDYLN